MVRSGGSRPRPWLPVVVVGAGALLATLSILLASWSKQLVKESLRYECTERAAGVSLQARAALDARLAALARGGPRPPEALAVWRLGADSALAARDPAAAPDPAPTLLEAARQHADAAPLPLSVRGAQAPLAATYLPLPPGQPDGARGLLVQWDLARVEADVLRPLIERSEGPERRFEAVLVRHDEGLPPTARALIALDAPLDGWRVAVGLEDPEAVRWSLRAQTVLLFAVAGWLLLLLAASVVVWMRREAAHTRRLAAREQLLARAYHELQTPLMLLRAAAESLERGAVERPDELRRCMGIVAREEERLTRSIRRLLRWLRVEGGGAEVPLAPLREEVEAAAREQEPGLRERGIRLELVLDGAVAGLLAPRDLVADVVRELLANVEKHARGATRVRVAVAAGARRDTARITVEDDGPGFPAAVLGAPPRGSGGSGEVAEQSAGGGRQGGASASGFGLGLLREGLLLCDGSLRLEPREGAPGARAVVEVAVHVG